MAQNVWMKVVRSAPSYRGEEKFAAWLMSLARNTCLSEMRRHSGKFEVPSEDAAEQADLSVDSAAFEQQVGQQDNLDAIKRKIEALPKAQRVVLTMIMTENLSYEQIAKELEMTVPAIKSLLFRARKSLQKAVRTET